MGGELPASDPRVQEVQKMGNLLVNDTKAKKSPWKFVFHVLADKDTVNAFALPGGQVFITLGLLNQLQNEAQLAGVIGHEMGHVIERHTAQQMSKSQLGQFFIVAVGAAASDSEGYGTNNSAAMIAGMVNQMIQLRYSRGDESEADVWGLKLMSQAGYNPYEMIKVMEILKSASGDKGHGPSFFQTHPDPDLRIEQIKAYLKAHPPQLNLQNGKSLREVFQATPASSTSEEHSWMDILQSLPN
jgi:predicted Zn-dependent protease